MAGGKFQRSKNNVPSQGSSNAYGSHNVSNAGVPPKIKCKRCDTVKGPNAFSETRLKDLTTKISKAGASFNPATEAHINCSACVGSQVVELHCIGCDKDKGLHCFAKTQRRKPDEARCFPCSEDLQNMGTFADSNGAGDEGGTDNDDDSDDSDRGGTGTMTGTFTSLSITNESDSNAGGVAVPKSAPRSGYGTYTSASKSYGNSSGGVTVAGTRSPSVQSLKTTRSSGLPISFDPTAYKKDRFNDALASTAGSSTSNFAKLKAVPVSINSAEAQRVRNMDDEVNLDSVTVQSDSESD